MRTVPLNQSAGPLAEGCVPLRAIFIVVVLVVVRVRRASASDAGLEMRRVAVAVHRDLRDGGLDLPEVGRRELHLRRAEVLLETMHLRGAGDRHDPRLLREEPGEGDLRWRRLLL